jgi:hypothetical protein
MPATMNAGDAQAEVPLEVGVLLAMIAWRRTGAMSS